MSKGKAMRWNRRYGLRDRLGERRTRRRFMWWPTRFGTGAVRWLEWANVVEEVTQVDVGGTMDWGNYAYHWVGICFEDEMQDNAGDGC